jgi:hypothetical protein
VRRRRPASDIRSIFMTATQQHALEDAVKDAVRRLEFDIDRGTYDCGFPWGTPAMTQAHRSLRAQAP